MVKSLPGNIALAVVSVACTLAATELVLRLFPHPKGHVVVVPRTHWTVTAAPAIIPGITGINHYRTNEWGIRGRPFGQDGAEYRVMAVGGSTTECAILDDSEAWPYLLEVALSPTADGRTTWVGNVGRSGLTTRDNALHLKYLPRKLPHIDAFVALVGANDLQAALQQGWGYQRPGPITDATEEKARTPRAFAYVAGGAEQGALGVSAWKATELWQLARRARNGFAAVRKFDLGRDGTNQPAVTRAQRRATRRWVDSLPSLADALAEYRSNLNAMVDGAAAAGARMVFVTQPTLWGEGLPESVDRLLAFGWIGADPRTPDGYFTAGVLARGMAAFNAELMRVCRERGVECVDLAATMSHDTTAMYDDMHFTERGSARLAELLAGYFRSKPPFRPVGG